MPPLLEGAIPARPHAARPAKGFFVNPAIYERETGRDGKLIIGVISTRPSEDVFQFARSLNWTEQARKRVQWRGLEWDGYGVLRGCVYFHLGGRTEGTRKPQLTATFEEERAFIREELTNGV